jgi:hypothetical protein
MNAFSVIACRFPPKSLAETPRELRTRVCNFLSAKLQEDGQLPKDDFHYKACTINPDIFLLCSFLIKIPNFEKVLLE